MAYLLSNIYAKNYWNWITTVEIIIGGWVVSFFRDTVYFKQCQTKCLSVTSSNMNRF